MSGLERRGEEVMNEGINLRISQECAKHPIVDQHRIKMPSTLEWLKTQNPLFFVSLQPPEMTFLCRLFVFTPLDKLMVSSKVLP